LNYTTEVRGTRDYAENAEQLFSQYESVTFESVHQPFLDLYAMAPIAEAGRCELDCPRLHPMGHLGARPAAPDRAVARRAPKIP
jgi:hypothetical protein